MSAVARGTLALLLTACATSAPPAVAPRPVAAPGPCDLTSHYTPTSAPPAAPLALPAPALPQHIIHQGDAFTVWGASYYLRSAVHRAEVAGRELTITGYIVKTNLSDAPICAVHKSGKADPEDCFAPIPTFWLGDRRDAPLDDCIRVVGFASNFAQLHDAILQYDSGRAPARYVDDYWGVELPNPLPAAGARLTLRGKYGAVFAKSSSGAVSDPVMGILDYGSQQVLEPAPALATLPGMTRKR